MVTFVRAVCRPKCQIVEASRHLVPVLRVQVGTLIVRFCTVEGAFYQRKIGGIRAVIVAIASYPRYHGTMVVEGTSRPIASVGQSQPAVTAAGRSESSPLSPRVLALAPYPSHPSLWSVYVWAVRCVVVRLNSCVGRGAASRAVLSSPFLPNRRVRAQSFQRERPTHNDG